MSSNKVLEEQINDRLNTEIEWSQLPKDDLQEFDKLLNDEEFIKVVVGQYVNRLVGDETQSQIENWSPGQFADLVAGDDMDIQGTIEMFKMML